MSILQLSDWKMLPCADYVSHQKKKTANRDLPVTEFNRVQKHNKYGYTRTICLFKY